MKTLLLALALNATTPVVDSDNVVIKNCELPKQLEGLPFTVCGEQIIYDRYGRGYLVCSCQWLIEEQQ